MAEVEVGESGRENITVESGGRPCGSVSTRAVGFR